MKYLILLILIVLNINVFNAFAENTQCTPKLANPITECNHDLFLVTLLTNANNMIEDAKKYASRHRSCSGHKVSCEKPMDCFEILQKMPDAKSGVYEIWPRTRITTNAINVYCDMDDDGGGWTVIQRRGDYDSGKEYFFQDWANYKKGFGKLQEDFWLGNDNIFSLTNQRPNMVKFSLSDWEGNQAYATYDEFYIDDEIHLYTMHVNNYRGTAGDSFSITNGVPFTTKDRDNDSHGDNCASLFKGAWWYTGCHASNLNGLYLRGVHESYADGVEWRHFKPFNYSLKDSAIKIRPKTFKTIKLDITPE